MDTDPVKLKNTEIYWGFLSKILIIDFVFGQRLAGEDVEKSLLVCSVVF